MNDFFKLSEHGTTVGRELMAGATTFAAMAYILVVNPQIMAIAGIDPGASFVATCPLQRSVVFSWGFMPTGR